MSEYMEQHTVARLIGAPPGYVGHDEGGQLTEAVRRRPYSVVLFDEIEKAHSDIQNILLQILEDGTLTDAQGRKADFSNTIILLTSNLGARCLAGRPARWASALPPKKPPAAAKKALQEAKDHFRPELMGRLDDVVLFDPLGPAQLAAIADRLLCELEERAARQGYTLRHTPAAAAALAGDTVPAYGARELRRKVSRAVEQAPGRPHCRRYRQPRRVVCGGCRSGRTHYPDNGGCGGVRIVREWRVGSGQWTGSSAGSPAGRWRASAPTNGV